MSSNKSITLPEIRHLPPPHSRRTYYRIRSGERPICPQEQQSLLNVLRQCGVTGKLEFDSYFEDYQW